MATIIDVRTKEEFLGGHATGSINIPLQQLAQKVEDIRQMEMPIILCCASGARSNQATQFLSAQGIACENAGSWILVNVKN